MEIFPEEAVEEARIARDHERTQIDWHYQYGDIDPWVLNVMEVKNRVLYPVAVAAHSLSAHLRRLRHRNEVEIEE